MARPLVSPTLNHPDGAGMEVVAIVSIERVGASIERDSIGDVSRRGCNFAPMPHAGNASGCCEPKKRRCIQVLLKAAASCSRQRMRVPTAVGRDQINY